jgi:hypothetical protein
VSHAVVTQFDLFRAVTSAQLGLLAGILYTTWRDRNDDDNLRFG